MREIQWEKNPRTFRIWRRPWYDFLDELHASGGGLSPGYSRHRTVPVEDLSERCRFHVHRTCTYTSEVQCGENKNCRLLNYGLWYMLVASTWRFSTFAAILTYFQPPAKGCALLREAYVEAYPSSGYGHRVKGRVSASVLVNNEWKDWVRKAFDSNQSVVKTCPECTRSSPRRLPKFPNRLLLIESSVSRRLWAKSLRKVVVGPSIKGEFQNVYLTCFETGALSESKLAFGRACKTSCVLFRRTNDILRVHAKKNFQKISSQSKMTTKFCLQFFFPSR